MAKKKTGTATTEKGVNKSEAIRRILSQQGLDAKPAAVIEALKAEGIDVSIGLINAVKGKMKGGTTKKAKASNGEHLSVTEIAAVVTEAGGFAKLNAILEGGIVSKLADIASKGQLEELKEGVKAFAALKS